MHAIRKTAGGLCGLLALLASGAVSAACDTTGTGAASALEQGGQGNLNCGNLSSAGQPLSPLTENGNSPEVIVTDNGSQIDWAVQGNVKDVDAVVVQQSDGKRCIYFYAGESDFSGNGLGTPDSNKPVKDWLVCGNDVTATPVAALGIAKSLDPFPANGQDNDASGDVTVGDVLQFTVVATNTGDLALTGVTVTDPGLGSTQFTCESTPLEPQNTCTLTGTRLVTAADVTAGNIVNTAEADSGETDPVTATVTVSVKSPAMKLDKQLVSYIDNDNPPSGSITLGDTLVYSLTVTNIGTSNLTGIVVNDPLTQTTCTVPDLGPGAPASCSPNVSYVVTAQDVAAGSVVNTATATSSQGVSAADSETVAVMQPAPLSNVEGSCDVPGTPADGLQDGVDTPGNGIAAVIGIGTGGDGNPVTAVCSDESKQLQCVSQCRPPPGFPGVVGPTSQDCLDALNPNLGGGAGPNGELPIVCRACALSAELPPVEPPGGLPAGSRYCWELSDQVTGDGLSPGDTFIPAKRGESGSARWSRIIGSTCYEITIEFYGVEYTYYTPTGCPSPPAN